MNSVDKVGHALDQAESAADDQEAAPTVRVAAGFLCMARPHIGQMLPNESGELDELLANAARWMLALRSDDAPVPELTA
jgi:hypothetical protein